MRTTGADFGLLAGEILDVKKLGLKDAMHSEPRGGLISITVGATHGKAIINWLHNPERVESYTCYSITNSTLSGL
jgi:hypothetical protein